MDCQIVNSLPGCLVTAAGTAVAIQVITEYRTTPNGEAFPHKTRYATADGTLITPAPTDTVSYGACKA